MSVVISSRCGILCEDCHYLKDGICPGKCCENSKPFWGDQCPVKACCENKHLQHCGQCSQFPCDLLKQFAYDPQQGDNGLRIETCLAWRRESQKAIIQEAEELLEHCSAITVASVTEDGFPRPCVMAKLGAEGLEAIYFSTGTSSRKTPQFQANPKAGLCYDHGGDSVTLLGTVEIVADQEKRNALWSPWMEKHFPGGPTDPELCLMKFVPREMTFFLKGKFGTMPLGE